MRLIIVRHAIAEDRDAAKWPEDGERPLTKRGRRRFVRAALGLARLVPDVDLVLSSPHIRAWDTALILTDEAGWPAPQVFDELRESSPWDVISALKHYEGYNTVALVGHEPYLGRFIAQLLSPNGGAKVELRKGAAACLELSEVGGSEPAQLTWLLQPRVMRLLS